MALVDQSSLTQNVIDLMCAGGHQYTHIILYQFNVWSMSYEWFVQSQKHNKIVTSTNITVASVL